MRTFSPTCTRHFHLIGVSFCISCSINSLLTDYCTYCSNSAIERPYPPAQALGSFCTPPFPIMFASILSKVLTCLKQSCFESYLADYEQLAAQLDSVEAIISKLGLNEVVIPNDQPLEEILKKCSLASAEAFKSASSIAARATIVQKALSEQQQPPQPF